METLMVFCHLLIPPATELLISRRLAAVLAISAATGIIATLSGVSLSFLYDIPTNHSICLAACTLLVVTIIARLAIAAFRKGMLHG